MRANANQPKFVLIAEATSERDSETARATLSLFGRIVKQEALTILLATHDSLVDEDADQVLGLPDGAIVAEEVS